MKSIIDFSSKNRWKSSLFSFNDIDTLLEIKDLIDQGINMAGIKQIFAVKEEQKLEHEIQKQVIKQKQDLS